jgi:hypothetical protein
MPTKLYYFWWNRTGKTTHIQLKLQFSSYKKESNRRRKVKGITIMKVARALAGHEESIYYLIYEASWRSFLSNTVHATLNSRRHCPLIIQKPFLWPPYSTGHENYYLHVEKEHLVSHLCNWSTLKDQGFPDR